MSGPAVRQTDPARAEFCAAIRRWVIAIEQGHLSWGALASDLYDFHETALAYAREQR